MKIHLTYGLLACIIAGIVTGCTQEQDMEWGNTSDKVIITGSIKDATTIQTRVSTDEFGSYSSGGFSEGNQIGFYSQRGNDGNPENAFQNLCLTYNYSYTGEESEEEKGQSFTSEELGTTPSNWGNVCAYFPYNEENNENINKDDIKIFDSDGQLIDLLFATSTGNSSLINFGFSHVFSMLFIIPGQGFSQAFEKNSNSITVVLEKGVANATVSKDRRSLTLNKTDDAQKEYKAKEATINGEECFYVLLPSETKVDYIIITDDFDKVQYVRPTSDQLPELARGTRYPITIQMTGDQPTIWPCEFTEWTQTEIKVERNVGIHDIAELKEWVNAYNTYCNQEEDETNLETLRNYGDYKDEKWTFYLNADMDLSTSSDLTQNISLLLPTFKDVLDGRNHTLSNITLNGNGNEAGIIGNLTGGTIKNLKLENVLITTTQTEKAIGGIANTVADGNIQNCKISGLRIDSKGIVGGIAGNITSGEISNNTCNGILTGASSDTESHYIIGTKTEEENAPTIEDNSVSNLIFQETH